MSSARQFDVVEEHGPGDVAELMSADHGGPRRARRTSATTAFALRRDRAGSRTSNPTVDSIGPTRVMNSHASSWLMATWPRRGTPARSSAGTSRTRRCHSPLIRRRPLSDLIAASNGMTVPCPTARRPIGATLPRQRRIELHQQPRAHRVGDGARPLIEPPGGGRGLRSLTREGRAIHAGNHHRVEVGRSGRGRRRRRQLHAFDALGDDRLDGSGDHRVWSSPDHRHRRRRRLRPASAAAAVDDRGSIEERRHPANAATRRGRPSGRSATRTLGTIAPRAASRTPFERDAAEPRHAGARRLRGRARRRWRPANRGRLSSGSETASARRPPGRGTPACNCQPTAGPPIDLQPVGQFVVAFGVRPSPAGPHHHLPRRPRGLQLHFAGLLGTRRRSPRRLRP